MEMILSSRLLWENRIERIHSTTESNDSVQYQRIVFIDIDQTQTNLLHTPYSRSESDASNLRHSKWPLPSIRTHTSRCSNIFVFIFSAPQQLRRIIWNDISACSENRLHNFSTATQKIKRKIKNCSCIRVDQTNLSASVVSQSISSSQPIAARRVNVNLKWIKKENFF